MSKKKSSYECFLERCSRKFWSHEERRDHCIKTHQFPADFKFDEARTDKPSRSSPPEDQASNQNVTDSHDMEIEEEEDENVVVRMREGTGLKETSRIDNYLKIRNYSKGCLM